jgi:hypothetical protein
MKNSIIILSILLFAQIGFSQAPPQGINYQAVVYSDNGNNQPGLNVPGQLLLKKSIRVRFTIIANATNGNEVYKESHATTTDAFGMFSIVIGQGTQEGSNSFQNINWGTGNHFLKVEIDKSGGTNYITMSNQQLWSVPYALYSGKSGSSDNATNSAHADSSDYSDLAGNGITGVSDNGNGTLTFTYLDGSTYTTGVLSGLTGPQGPAGATGAQGVPGPIGATGPQGPAGTPGSQNAWSLTGNSGTNPITNFIGTTDAQDWAIKTNNTERLRVTSAGNVGLGVISPSSRLDVYTNNNFNYAVKIQNGGGAGQGLLVKASAGSTNPKIFNVQDNYGNDRFSVFGLGNVGVGTSSPLGKLHVNNDVSGSDSSFVVTTGGNVGIGTSTPQSNLEVVGTSKFGIGGQATTEISWENGTLLNSLGTFNTYSGGIIKAPLQGQLLFQIRGNHWDDGLMVLTDKNLDGTPDAIPFKVLSNGNVGVGDLIPQRNLHIKDVMRLEPRATAPTSPAKGDMYFDSTLNKLRVYDGTAWQSCW